MLNSSPRLQKITNLSDDGQSEKSHFQIIIDGEVFTFPVIKSYLNNLLSISDESDEKTTAFVIHFKSLMARIESGEDLANELAAMLRRLDELKAVQS